jgi:hypothetical protein
MASVEKVGKRWRVPYYESVEGVKRRRYRTFQKKIDAEEFLADQRLEQQGSSLAVSTEERMLIVRLRSVAALAGVSLPEAVQKLEQVIKTREKQSPLLKDAVAQYLTSCRERNKSQDTLTQYSGYLTDLITRHHGRRVADVSRADALEYILTRYRNDASRGFVRTSVVSFFRWSQRQGWCTGWDQKLTWDRTRVMEQRVTIMSTEDFTAILRHAPESIRLGLALMGFVGIRPEELTSPHPKTVLRWTDIDLPSRCIHIPGAVSKVGKYRCLHDLPPNVWQWIEATPKNERRGHIITCNYRNFRAARTRAMIAGSKLSAWPKDILRHSAASYGFHVVGYERAIEWLGHTNPKTFFRHYKSAASAATAQQWYAIAP